MTLDPATAALLRDRFNPPGSPLRESQLKMLLPDYQRFCEIAQRDLPPHLKRYLTRIYGDWQSLPDLDRIAFHTVI